MLKKYIFPLALVTVFILSSEVGSEQPAPKPPAEKPLPRPKAVPPPERAALEGSIRRGVEFLLKDQNKDGSWGSAHRTKGLNIYAPVPGAHHAFRTAVTAMCVTALLESGDHS